MTGLEHSVFGYNSKNFVFLTEVCPLLSVYVS